MNKSLGARGHPLTATPSFPSRDMLCVRPSKPCWDPYPSRPLAATAVVRGSPDRWCRIIRAEGFAFRPARRLELGARRIPIIENRIRQIGRQEKLPCRDQYQTKRMMRFLVPAVV